MFFFFFFLRPAPKNEDEMMILIFEYIDRIFSIVRPRKLLYMAIDGVVCKMKIFFGKDWTLRDIRIKQCLPFKMSN